MNKLLFSKKIVKIIVQSTLLCLCIPAQATIELNTYFSVNEAKPTSVALVCRVKNISDQIIKNIEMQPPIFFSEEAILNHLTDLSAPISDSESEAEEKQRNDLYTSILRSFTLNKNDRGKNSIEKFCKIIVSEVLKGESYEFSTSGQLSGDEKFDLNPNGSICFLYRCDFTRICKEFLFLVGIASDQPNSDYLSPADIALPSTVPWVNFIVEQDGKKFNSSNLIRKQWRQEPSRRMSASGSIISNTTKLSVSTRLSHVSEEPLSLEEQEKIQEKIIKFINIIKHNIDDAIKKQKINESALSSSSQQAELQIAQLQEQLRQSQLEQQQRADELEQQRRADELEQQRRAEELEQQRRAEELEQQRRAEELEQQRRAEAKEEREAKRNHELKLAQISAEAEVKKAQAEAKKAEEVRKTAEANPFNKCVIQ